MTRRFISFEGGEGSGKSTQARRLKQWLAARGEPCLLTREPGGSDGAEEIRRLLVTGEAARWDGMTEALLVSAARRDHVVRTIRPALEAGGWVITDRFSDSTLAYQGYGRGVPMDQLQELQRFATDGLTPGLTLWLELPVSEGLRRAAARRDEERRFEETEPAFHDRIAQGFAALAAAEPRRFCRIDAGKDRDAVERAILDAVCAHFPDLRS